MTNVDLEAGESIDLNFDVDCFNKMLTKTYQDYYPNNYNQPGGLVRELLKVVVAENLVEKYQADFCNKPTNILTMQSSPWLDLGDLPV